MENIGLVEKRQLNLLRHHDGKSIIRIPTRQQSIYSGDVLRNPHHIRLVVCWFCFPLLFEMVKDLTGTISSALNILLGAISVTK